MPMTQVHDERQLVAIMFTDVVGYTALTEQDEAAAVRVRERHRDLVRTLVEQFDGELVDVTGDESLSIFPSALRAVDCALALQGALRSHPDLRLRIGIHLGDVLRRGGEVIGDGVNVAARVRPLAQPGGICVSEPVYQMIRTRSHVVARALGPQTLKNVGEAVPVYALSTAEAGETVRRPGRRRARAVWVALLVAGALAAAVIVLNRGAIVAWVVLNAPPLLSTPIEQQIGFAETSDGVRIAYATTGSGPAAISVLGWATLEAVVDALGLERFALNGISAGGPTAIAYTVRHPERATHLVLGSTGPGPASTPEDERIVPPEVWRSRIGLIRTSWGSPPTRAMIAEWLAPEANDVERRVLMHLLRVSGEGPAVAAFFEAGGEIDTSEEARRVRVPTLVVAGDADPGGMAGGRRLASLIPGARFEILEGAGHIEAAVSDPRGLRLRSAFFAETSVERPSDR
jgi:class 3 adenylate cyclase